MRTLTLGERLKRVNWLLFGVALVLSAAGLLLVGLASRDARTNYGSPQLRWVVLGVTCCLLVLAVPYRRIVSARYVAYALTLIALIAVLLVGRGKSAARWIELGGFRAQPSEMAKVVLVLVLAGWMRYGKSHREWSGIWKPLALAAVPALLIMLQPDLGTAVILVPLVFTMLYVSGARREHLGLLAGAGVVAGLLLFLLPGLMPTYQRDRVNAFLQQHADDRTLQRYQLHHLHQSKTVVGTAAFFGAGLGDDAVEAVRYLPERHSDFIFPVAVTAIGTLGAAFLLALQALLVGLVLRTALTVREPSGRLLCVGIGALFSFQTVVNLMMTVGLLPIVGMPLPFLSYGGSSLLTSFVALGLVLNVGADSPVEFGRGDFQ